MKVLCSIIKNNLFFNEKEKSFLIKITIALIVFFILINITGAIYSDLFYNNILKIILLEFLFIIILLNPLNGLYLVLLAVPLEFTETWFHYHVIKLYRIIIVFMFVSWGARKVIYKDFGFLKYFRNKLNILLMSLILWNIITIFYSVLWKDGLGEIMRMSFYFMFVIVLLDCFQDHNKLKIFIYYLLSISIIIAAAGSYEKFFGKSIYYPSGYHRIASTIFDPNMFGRYLMINALFIFSLILYKKRNLYKNMILFMGLGLFLMDIILTRSRSSLLAFLAGAFILTIFHKKRKILIPLFISILIVIFLLLPLEYKTRIKTIIAPGIEGRQFHSTKARIALELAGLKIIRHHLFFGVGVGSFPHYFFKYNKLPYDSSESHDFLTRTFAELGIIGLILSLVVIYLILKDLYLLYKKNNYDQWIFVSLFSVIVSIFIHAVLYSPFFYYFYLWFFIFIIIKSKEQLELK